MLLVSIPIILAQITFHCFEFRIQPEVFLSKDRNTVICYHPAPNYPKEKTKVKEVFSKVPNVVHYF